MGPRCKYLYANRPTHGGITRCCIDLLPAIASRLSTVPQKVLHNILLTLPLGISFHQSFFLNNHNSLTGYLLSFCAMIYSVLGAQIKHSTFAVHVPRIRNRQAFSRFSGTFIHLKNALNIYWVTAMFQTLREAVINQTWPQFFQNSQCGA